MTKQELAENVAYKILEKYDFNEVDDGYKFSDIIHEATKETIDACLTELAKQSGEFREFLITMYDEEDEVGHSVGECREVKQMITLKYDQEIHVIDHAALLAANAKNTELQQRVKELEQELKDLRVGSEIMLKEKCKTITALEAKLEKAEEIIVNFESGLLEKIELDRNVFELKQKISSFSNCIASDDVGAPLEINKGKVCVSCCMPHFVKGYDHIMKVATLEAKLQKAEKVIEFYADKETYKRDSPLVDNKTTKVYTYINEFLMPCWGKIVRDFGQRARTYLQNKGG